MTCDRKCWASLCLTIPGTIEHLHMMSQHSNSLATATAAILVHNENLLRLCTKMAAVFHGKRSITVLWGGGCNLTGKILDLF